MKTSILIARIASIVYLAAALGALLDPGYYRKVVDDLFGNAALTYVTGFITVILGFLIVHFHNFWKKDWTVLITIVGWIALIKGVLIIAAPQLVLKASAPFVSDASLAAFPYAALLLGLLFGYFGFVQKQ